MSTDTSTRAREPRGVTIGGRFAHERRDEPTVSLAQQRALDDLVGPGLRPARAMAALRQPTLPGAPKAPANAGTRGNSPVARFRAGEQTVAELITRHGWEQAVPVEQHDARFEPVVAATNGERIVQSYVDADHDTTCLVSLPARPLPGQDPWSRAEYVSTAGRRVDVTAVGQSTGIVSLRTYEESEARPVGGRLSPADLAAEVDALAC